MSSEDQQQPAKQLNTGDTFWDAFLPQNLPDMIIFEKGYGFKKAVQQDLMNSARKTLHKQGRISEFDYNLSESSVSEPQCKDEVIKKVNGKTKNPGSSTMCKLGGRPRGNTKTSS